MLVAHVKVVDGARRLAIAANISSLIIFVRAPISCVLCSSTVLMSCDLL